MSSNRSGLAYNAEKAQSDLRSALDFAKSNPDHPDAVELRRRMERGMFNFELRSMGLPEVPVNQPNVDLSKAMSLVQSQPPAPQSVIPEPEPEEQASIGPVDVDVSFSGIKERFGDVKDTFVGVGEALNERIDRAREIGQDDDFNVLQKFMGFSGQLAGGAADTVGELVTGAGKLVLTQEAEESFAEFVNGVSEDVADTAVVQGAVDWYNNLDKDNQLIVESVGGIAALAAEVVGLKGGGKVVSKSVDASVDAAQAAREAAGEVGDKVTDFRANRATAAEAAKAEADRTAIQNIIAPGLDAKEIRKAMDEGRLTRGAEGFWIGKKPDVVEVTDRVKEISDTIQTRIPDASTLDDVNLNNRLKVEIENIAADLEPKMAEVKLRDITPSETPIAAAAKKYSTADEFIAAFNKGELDVDTVERIKAQFGDDVFDDQAALADLFTRAQNPSMVDSALTAWERTKIRQQNSPEFVEFAGAKRFQEIFETHLNKITKGGGEKTLNDLWKIRKDYDASIPERVKTANDNSPITSQIQRDMWLENRRILNDIINDSSRGLGDESRQAFSDMSDLYTARQNIVSKTKLDTKGAPGLVGKAKDAVFDRALPFGFGGLIF